MPVPVGLAGGSGGFATAGVVGGAEGGIGAKALPISPLRATALRSASTGGGGLSVRMNQPAAMMVTVPSSALPSFFFLFSLGPAICDVVASVCGVMVFPSITSHS